ncbi:MAG: FAD-dependent oxidoreductase [Rhodospirillaceae bacterium]|nr:FAD-dependent oxidoreductase [Rhodospirillaceae bacterium]
MSGAVVIVGAGQAGAQAAITLRQQNFAGSITLVGDEGYVPYERPPLSKSFLAGDSALEKMFMRAPEFYAEHAIDVRLNTSVMAIDRTAKSVRLNDGGSLAYDKLVLATGGRVRRLSLPGGDLPQVKYLRTIADVLEYRDRLQPGTRLVIVGGGYIGLEVAAVAVKRGCAVTVLEAMPLVLNRVVAPELSRFYQQVHAAAGVTIATTAGVTAFEPAGAGVDVLTSTGRRFAADLVIVGIGIAPNVELAAAAGLAVDNGIVVDAFATTADPDIFAAGDCTNHPSVAGGGRVRLESVQNALSQGKTAALAILGQGAPYDEIPWFWSDQYDLKLQMTGLSRPGDQVVIRGAMAERKFSACYLRDGVLVACHAVNQAKDFIQSKKLIAARASVDPARLADVSVALKDLT